MHKLARFIVLIFLPKKERGKSMKIFPIFLLSLITLITSQNIHGMDNSKKAETIKFLNVCLENQKYEELTNFLYSKLDQQTGDLDVKEWVSNKAYQTGSVHLMYFLIREFSKKQSKTVLETPEIARALQFILISLVRIKQDMACMKPDNKELTEKAQTTYKTFKQKFWYFWKETILNQPQLPDFKNALAEVLSFFTRKNSPPQLPSPAWVTCCKFKEHGLIFTFWTSWGIDFANPSDVLKQSFNGIDFSEARAISAQKTIEEFSKFNNWAEFFSEK
jgi:hypothetical protein